jgi:cholesterol oxidase
MGSFPRAPYDLARRMFWNVPSQGRSGPGVGPEKHTTGLFDIRVYKKMQAVIAAGLGGGSLIYANVLMMPPDAVFDARWPASCRRDKLMPYYRVAKEVLGARPIPQNDDPRRRIVRTERFQQVAKANNRKSELVDIMVFFGNDFNNPLAIGEQARNRYGALQTSCVYCAECDIGCNTHSKNTVDLNYLHVAENRYGAHIVTEHRAEKIVPVNAQGDDDPAADGSHGYRVYYRDVSSAKGAVLSALTNRVVVSAGTLGTTELLLRCRPTLPRLSSKLGQRFSGNGDFLAFVIGGADPAEPNYGPVITQRIDYNLHENFDPDRAFVMEDAGYPALASWFTEGAKPAVLNAKAALKAGKATIRKMAAGEKDLGEQLTALVSDDISYGTSVLLCMGVDKSDGVLTLDKNGSLDIDWPQHNSMPLYDAIVKASDDFRKAAGAKVVAIPGWQAFSQRNVTVHALGGCTLADDAGAGVTSADPATFGQVFGYQGLYVADGALLPTAVGANPVATISSLSEMVAEGITGIAPEANL